MAGRNSGCWQDLPSLFENHRWMHHSKHLLVIGAAAAGLYLTWKIYKSRKNAQSRKKWASVGKDVVILHQFPRSKFTPSMSPFPIKLETYLRMAKIPYQNDFSQWRGPKGKTPWITLNGEDVADSQLCMEYLARKFNKDFSSHLSPEDQAVGRAMRIMAEEHLLWVAVLWRFVYTKARDLPVIMPNMPFIVRNLFIPLAAKNWKQAAYGQGMARHSEAEVVEMGVQDMRALSRFLGTKPFFMGDKPTEIDCTMFGFMCQVVWNMPDSPFEQLINGEFSNLKDYTMRMKEMFWPDWDQCLAEPLPTLRHAAVAD